MGKSLTFTVVLEKGEKYWIAYCPEIPEANGQGETKEEAIDDLKESAIFVLEARREEGLQGVSPDAITETITFA